MDYHSVNYPNSKNYKIYYPINNNSSVIKSLKSGRIWEKKLLKYFDEYIEENTNTIDIGSYIGSHSLYMSSLCNKVYAFDPQKFVGECFRKTLEENNLQDKIIFNNIGIWESEKKVMFGTNNDGDASLSCCRKKATFKNNYNILVKKLDDFNLNNISLIKIDAEGAGIEILRGADNLIDVL